MCNPIRTQTQSVPRWTLKEVTKLHYLKIVCFRLRFQFRLRLKELLVQPNSYYSLRTACVVRGGLSRPLARRAKSAQQPVLLHQALAAMKDHFAVPIAAAFVIFPGHSMGGRRER